MRPILIFLASLLAAPETVPYAPVAQSVEQVPFKHRAVGSIPTGRTTPEPTPSGWWWVRATVTGYSPRDAIDAGHPSTADTKTSTMKDWRTHPYGIAADPRIIPYGTAVHVPGYLEKSYPWQAWEVDDTGGGMRRSWRRGIVHLDVRFKTTTSAKNFGKRNIDVLVCVEDMTEDQKKRLLPYRTGEL